MTYDDIEMFPGCVSAPCPQTLPNPAATPFCGGKEQRRKSVEFELVFCRPQMNFVIGPNGTGKSSVVCALCVGLNGSTKVQTKRANGLPRPATVSCRSTP